MIKDIIQASVDLKKKILDDDELIDIIDNAAEECRQALKRGRKVLFCGNGGSAADAQHLAAELSGRFYFDRHPLDAEALHVNTSYLTGVANDYDYSVIYSRLIEARGNKGDILVALSTSGNSSNIIKAAQEARSIGMIVIGLTGASGGKLAEECDFIIKVPSDDTPRIQENHIMIGHIMCEIIEKKLFSR